MTQQLQSSFTEKIQALLFQDPEELYHEARDCSSLEVRNECARAFFAAGKYVHENNGDLRGALYYLERSTALAPVAECSQERAQVLEAIAAEAAALESPYDTAAAVAAYDDADDLRQHANLDNSEFFAKTRRGSYRKAIAEGIKQIYHSGAKILEVGCAAGGYYYTLKKILGRINYVGFDISNRMVERAHQHFPEVPFLRADAKAIPFADQQFDIVFATDVVNFVSKWRQVFTELYRVTRRNLVLRLRTLVNDSLPTQELTVGNRYLSYPYVLFNVNDLNRFIHSLSPAPQGMKLLQFVPEASVTFDAIDLARFNLPRLNCENGVVALNTLLDLIIVKP